MTKRMMLGLVVLAALVFGLGACGGGGGGGGGGSDFENETSVYKPSYSIGVFSSGDIIGVRNNLSGNYRDITGKGYVVAGTVMAGYDSSPVILNLRRTSDLSLLDSVSYEFNVRKSVHAIAISNGYLYDFDGVDLFVYDISSSKLNLVYKTNNEAPNATINSSTSAVVENNYLYIFGGARTDGYTDRLDVYSLSNPARPTLYRSVTPSLDGISSSSGFVNNHYVLSVGNKIVVFSLNNGNPVREAYIENFSSNVAICSGQIFVASGENLDYYQVLNDGRLSLSSTLPINPGMGGMSCNGNLLYLSQGGVGLTPLSGFALYDVTNQGNPVLLGAAGEYNAGLDSTWPYITDNALFFYDRESGNIVKFNAAASTPPPVSAPQTIDIVGSWNYTVTSSNCPGISETGSFNWTHSSSGYGLSFSSGNAYNFNTCTSIGPQSCGDPGPYPASNPINTTEFQSGMNAWNCTNSVVSSVNFISSDSISYTATKDGVSGQVTMSRQTVPQGDSVETWNVAGKYSTCPSSATAYGSLQISSSNATLTSFTYTGENWHHDCRITPNISFSGSFLSHSLTYPLASSEIKTLCEVLMSSDPYYNVSVLNSSSTAFTCRYYDTFDGSIEDVVFTK